LHYCAFLPRVLDGLPRLIPQLQRNRAQAPSQAAQEAQEVQPERGARSATAVPLALPGQAL
jgi:hypothetical protein